MPANRPRTIPLTQVARIPALHVRPGMVTVDGVVLAVDVRQEASEVVIRMRSATYVVTPEETIIVFARLDHDTLAAVYEAIPVEPIVSTPIPGMRALREAQRP